MLTARPRGAEVDAGAGEQPAFEAVAATLARLGADTAFGVLGSGNFRLTERLASRHAVSYHWARHETAAVTMADAWARVTGRVGVCTVHQGPGLTNAMTGLAEAAKARTPLVLVAGEVATTAAAVNQRIDQDGLARAAGAQAERVLRGSTAVRDTERAWRRARAERTPVVLSFPVDVQDEACPAPPAESALDLPAPAEPSADAIAAVADLVARARTPLVVGGRGAVLAGAGPALEDVAARIGALLATSAPAHGLFSGSPWSLGISGGFASPLAQQLIPRADLVLAFGASLNHWTTRRGELIGAGARVVQCDSDLAALRAHRPDAIGILGDAAASATALAAELDRRGVQAPRRRWDLDADALRDPGWRISGESAPGTVDPRALLVRLDGKLPEQRTLATDAGHFQGYPPMHLRVPDAHGFVMTQAFQSVGLGLATGIGAAVARPDRPTVAVVGDGGLMMSLGELDSAAAHGLPLLIVVLDDGAYGAEVHHFGPMGESTELVEFGDRDFAGVARALGIPAQTVRRLEDLDEGPLDAWARHPSEPLLLDCKVDAGIRAEWLQEAFRGGA
jgi:thiamine pyrophosphate-dependent acetolactate synthase large subunit-like protein